MPTPITRRALLRAGGTASLAVLLSACNDATTPGDGATDGAADGQSPSEGPANGEDISTQALEAVGLEGPATLTPIIATFEVLTGPTGRIPFGLLDPEQQPLLDQAVQLWVVRDGEVVTGPVEPIFFGEGLGQRGIYVAEVELEEPGLVDAVVQLEDGTVGVAAVSVTTPEDSTTYPPGSEFPVIATPTVDDPGELEELCTRNPPCSMHDISLDTALAAGGPVVLSVATPAFCQTAVCGPVIDVLAEVRDQQERDDVTYIHAEVYNDAGVTPSQVVNELQLPSEPWTWVIAADGTVVDRFDGPVVPSLLSDAIQRA